MLFQKVKKKKEKICKQINSRKKKNHQSREEELFSGWIIEGGDELELEETGIEESGIEESGIEELELEELGIEESGIGE